MIVRQEGSQQWSTTTLKWSIHSSIPENVLRGFHVSAMLVFLVLLLLPVSSWGEHPNIFLLDKNGDEINPITRENDKAPFSTEQTCGMCHDYEEITSGYHFQMGWDVVSDTFGVKDGIPWQISDGMMGKWCPLYLRQLAKKKNDNADEIDLTVYDFVGFTKSAGSENSCGTCHPGGGGLEYDREGNRYDEMLAENPELRNTFDGDYYQSNWDKSGVVEADCFICHLDGYNNDARIEQLSQGNYQWAVVAGSKMGLVEGSVVDGDEPVVIYNKRYFNEDGSISPTMSMPPPDDNCMFCHGQSDTRKRGFSWNDIHNPDIHNMQGIGCVGCHPSGIDHQFAKGYATDLGVADSLDGSMRDCSGCHEEGYLGATIPKHSKVRPSHLKKIACETCHIPTLHRAAAQGFESTTGEQVFYMNPPEAKEFGELAEWKPVLERRNGRIYPYNSLLTMWWGNLGPDSIIYPLWLKEQGAGWELFSDKVTDDNGDGIPEVNRKEEIVAGIQAYTTMLKNNKRFDFINPVYVKGGKAYYLDDSGNLKILENESIPCINYSISHNVAPAHLTLGASGCQDCHSPNSHVFRGQRVDDLYDENGKPVTHAIGHDLGCTPVAFIINSFHQRFLRPHISLAIILVIFLITFHYHSVGPKHIPFVPDSGEVPRFTFVERGVHLFRLLAFIILTFTGIIIAFNLYLWQDLFFSSPKQMLNIHIGAGIVFIITTLMGIKLWFKDALFASYDKDWVRRMGGYLGYKGEVPAGRFNAGQKGFFWYTTTFGLIISITGVMLIYKSIYPLSVVCITSTIHNLVAFILIAGVLSHAYLGTIANPGTWRVLVDGYVSKVWAKHHHPNWFRSLVEKGVITDDIKEHSEIQKDSSDDIGTE